MAKRNIDVFLNAYDNTGPGTAGASSAVASYADSVVASNQVVTASFQTVGNAAEDGILASLAGIAAAAVPAIAAVGAIAAGAYLIYQNWQSVTQFFGSIANYISESMTGMWETIRTTGYAALATIEFAFINWRDVVELVLVGVQYRVVQAFNSIAYFGTEVLPAVFKYIGENFNSIMTQLLENLRQVLLNALINIANFMLNIQNVIEGKDWAFVWKPLSDGLSISLQNLPQIAERQLGPLEQSLKERFEAIGDKAGEGLGAHIAKRLADIPGFKKDIADFFSGIFGAAKDFVFPSLGGGQRGIGQIETPDGESSRFLSGSAAASQEQLMREQLELQRMQAEAAQATRENSTAMRALLSGDIAGALKILAANKAAKVVING